MTTATTARPCRCFFAYLLCTSKESESAAGPKPPPAGVSKLPADDFPLPPAAAAADTDAAEATLQTALGSGPGDAATTVAAHKLADILHALPPGQTVTMTPARHHPTLRSGRSRFTLQTLPAEDFPALPPADDGVDLRLPQARLCTLPSHEAFAMAAPDIRYHLNGVLLSAEGRRLTAATTDGNRLVLAHVTLDADVPPFSVILPRKTVHELQRLLRPQGDGALAVHVGAAQVRFGTGGIEFISKLIEGRFPDYRRVLPANLAPSLSVARVALLAALERVALLTSDSFRGVRLQLEPGLLRISASNAAQEEAQEELAVGYDGPAVQIGLNVRYVIELLMHISADTVQMATPGPQGSVLFTLPAQPHFAYVVSPMRM